MLGAVHEYRMRILESHLDTFSHVNNAAYLQILEEARWDLVARNGYGLEEVHRRQIGPVILDVHVRFTKELRNRQPITIRSWTESYNGKIGKFAQQIVDENGDVCCDALFTMGLFDLSARRLIRPTPEWVRAMGLQPEELAADRPDREAQPVTAVVPLTPRFVEAVAYATDVHAGQSRKGTTVPYLSHVLGVCSLVLEDGGGEDEAIAALLHDAVEDGGGQPVLEEIRRRFGDRVAEIVRACSDTDETPKPPWKERKARYIAHVRSAGPDVRRVSCADKLHNARSILRDYRLVGERLWDRFNAPPDEQLWYYHALVDAFRQPGSTPLVDELARVVGEIEFERSRVLDRSDLG